MVLKLKEIEKDIIEFVNGWAYSRKLPETEIATSNPVKKVKFGRPVYGRELEFFHLFNGNALPIEFSHINQPHWVTIFSHTKKVIKQMEELGYFLRAEEYLMKLSPITKMGLYDHHRVKKVMTKEQAKEINHDIGFEKFNPNRIESDPNIHYYFIEADNKPVCTGVISTIGESSCLDRILTEENYRGQGFAASLCYTMLNDLRGQGVIRNILGSSEVGSHLYQKLGYETIIPMYVFENR